MPRKRTIKNKEEVKSMDLIFKKDNTEIVAIYNGKTIKWDQSKDLYEFLLTVVADFQLDMSVITTGNFKLEGSDLEDLKNKIAVALSQFNLNKRNLENDLPEDLPEEMLLGNIPDSTPEEPKKESESLQTLMDENKKKEEIPSIKVPFKPWHSYRVIKNVQDSTGKTIARYMLKYQTYSDAAGGVRRIILVATKPNASDFKYDWQPLNKVQNHGCDKYTLNCGIETRDRIPWDTLDKHLSLLYHRFGLTYKAEEIQTRHRREPEQENANSNSSGTQTPSGSKSGGNVYNITVQTGGTVNIHN